MSAIKQLNQGAEVAQKGVAMAMNYSAAMGLSEVLKTNLGPKGTLKMLVSGSGDIKLSKDGTTLLHEMQVQHPTASLIARTATAQDDQTGDGTTTTCLVLGELFRQSERLISDSVHPRVVAEGIDKGKTRVLEFLEDFKTKIDSTDREMLTNVVFSSIATKLPAEQAKQLADILVDAVLIIQKEGEPLDLHMVEVMHQQTKFESDSRLVRGLVLDHGARHPDMKPKLDDVYVLTCNVSLEYDKTEITSTMNYKSADERQKMANAERKLIDERCQKVIDLKRKLCEGTDKGFAVINQKGVDPSSLEMLAREGIVALRRAKRRNMERLPLACGGEAVNSFDDLTEEQLGHAEVLYEHVLGEEKYTFIEGVQNPHSCTILLRGPTLQSIAAQKEAVRDGLRAAKLAIEDAHIVPGAGAFELAASQDLMTFSKSVKGKEKLGVIALAEALLVVPKVLAENSGLDAQETIITLKDEHEDGHVVGLDIETGDPIDPVAAGIVDGYRVKRQFLQSAPVICSQLLLIDEVVKAGKSMRK